MSVWVCSAGGYKTDGIPDYNVPSDNLGHPIFCAKDCTQYRDGICKCGDMPDTKCDAVEYAEVKRGKWILSMLYSVPTRACSVCGMIMPDFWKGPYCECGALMEASDGK